MGQSQSLVDMPRATKALTPLTDQQETTALNYLKKYSIAKTDVDGAMKLASDLFFGKNGKLQNHVAAASLWAWIASHHENRDAMFNLAVCYHSGSGVAENQERAVEL